MKSVLITVIILLVSVGNASAENKRVKKVSCNRGIIDVGMSLDKVKSKCTTGFVISESYNQLYVVNNTGLIDSSNIEVWEYRPQGGFKRYLTFRNGSLVEMVISSDR